MKIKKIHSWNISYKEAITLQKNLADRIENKPVDKMPRIYAGMDISCNMHSNHLFAAVVLYDAELSNVIEKVTINDKIDFPYIPGLLSFREAPLYLKALKKLKHTPDIILVDGHGIAHPRRLGIASHIGLFVDLPVIGCAKKIFVGEYTEPGSNQHEYSYLTYNDNEVGVVYRSRTNVKPIFLSNGNRTDIDSIPKVIKPVMKGLRIPEPIRLSHQLCNEARKSY